MLSTGGTLTNSTVGAMTQAVTPPAFSHMIIIKLNHDNYLL
jgi:hypothetical protein